MPASWARSIFRAKRRQHRRTRDQMQAASGPNCDHLTEPRVLRAIPEANAALLAKVVRPEWPKRQPGPKLAPKGQVSTAVPHFRPFGEITKTSITCPNTNENETINENCNLRVRGRWLTLVAAPGLQSIQTYVLRMSLAISSGFRCVLMLLTVSHFVRFVFEFIDSVEIVSCFLLVCLTMFACVDAPPNTRNNQKHQT